MPKVTRRTDGFRVITLGVLMLCCFVPKASALVNGGLDISYRNYLTKGADTVESTLLAQKYTVNYRGGLYNRRFATLDTGVTYDLQDNKYDERKSSSDNLGFRLTSVILPKSPIPFTLYMNRYSSNSESRPDPGSKATTTIYGFYWVLPFKGVIPEINITYNQTHLKDENPTNSRDELDRVTTLVLTKRRKQSYYFLSYRNLMEESKGGNDATTHTFDFKGWYKLSGRSMVDLTSMLKDAPDGQDFTTRVHYDITFSRDASLRADYQFSRDDNEGTVLNQNSFSSSLYYRPMRKVSTTTSYSYNAADSPASSTSSHYLSENVSLMPLPNLNLNGDVSFNTTESGDSSGDSSRFNLSALFHKPFSRAQWSLGANIGYTTVTSGDSSSETFTRSEYTGLASRNLRYMNATASLSNHHNRSDSTTRDEYMFATTVSSNYFRRLNLSATYNYNILEETTATSESYRRDYSNFDATATYNMWYGMLVGAGYSLRMSSDSEDEVNTYIDWNWNFSLFRRVFVGLTARRGERTSDGLNDSVTYSYSSRLAYRIGRLALSLEYSYLKEERKVNNTEERSYFVRVTRTF